MPVEECDPSSRYLSGYSETVPAGTFVSEDPCLYATRAPSIAAGYPLPGAGNGREFRRVPVCHGYVSGEVQLALGTPFFFDAGRVFWRSFWSDCGSPPRPNIYCLRTLDLFGR